jgi:hypothetical protein
MKRLVCAAALALVWAFVMIVPASAEPPPAGSFGLCTAHFAAIPEGVPGHEHVPEPVAPVAPCP